MPITDIAGEQITVAPALRSRLERGDVIVDLRTVASSGGPIAEVLALFDAGPARVWPLIDRCADYAKTMKGVREAAELSRKDGIVRARVTIKMPFPLKDLTSITEAVHTVEEGTFYQRAWKLVEGDYRRNEGSWTLQPYLEQSDRTIVRYRIHAEPKIRIPGKLQQIAQKKALPLLISHLRAQL